MKLRIIALVSLTLAVFTASTAYAATSPDLGTAGTFSILSSTYTNTAVGTTLNGDLGYVTGPAVAPVVSGTTHAADGTYNQAGIDQNTALIALNSQACTFNFAGGAINLATDTTHGTVGVYTPGVYCITGAASVGTAGITLNGSGAYIFRITGALTTATNSTVTASGGASACDLWWTPGAATTLGANTVFAGSDIDTSGITIGSTVSWTGRALAFGGTVSTAADTLNTVPACAAAAPLAGAALGTSTTATGTAKTTPGLPNTGLAPQAKHTPWGALTATCVVVLSATYLIRKNGLHFFGSKQK